jgi:putative transposase
MTAVAEFAPAHGVAPICEALAVSRATFYRRHRASKPRHVPSRRASKRALDAEERQLIVDLLHREEFVDITPTQVYATLLEQGRYLCSPRTMYRILSALGENHERRDQRVHPQYQKPELLATAPNQVWSWDITKLRGPVKWTYFYLYVILDIFSRYVVGWLIANRESAALAERLIDETCKKQNIQPGQLTLHADRGSAMKAKPVAFLCADLGITKTHSRPHVSDDNPYSEAQFKTLKYRPDFPERFGSSQDARGFCCPFFDWYNNEHHHSGIGLMTPASVHYGRVEVVQTVRQATLAAAFAMHPERFVRGLPKPPRVPDAAWINPPREKPTLQETLESILTNTPDPNIARNGVEQEHRGDLILDLNGRPFASHMELSH